VTARQRAVIQYLREHGPTRQDALAEAFGTTLRGIGGTLSALTWNDDVRIFSRRSDTEGTEATVWEVR
jgi:hypothetical protein